MARQRLFVDEPVYVYAFVSDVIEPPFGGRRLKFALKPPEPAGSVSAELSFRGFTLGGEHVLPSVQRNAQVQLVLHIGDPRPIVRFHPWSSVVAAAQLSGLVHTSSQICEVVVDPTSGVGGGGEQQTAEITFTFDFGPDWNTPAPEQRRLELLIYVCSPTIQPLPAAMSEAREIQERLGESAVVKNAWGTPQDLLDALTTSRPRCFLFVGHADAVLDGELTLGFTGALGNLHMVPPDVLADAFADKQGLELVLLNGCRSSVLGELVHHRGVPYVVCWSTAVLDRAAKLFSTSFFRALKNDANLEGRYGRAFEEAKKAVRIATDDRGRQLYKLEDPALDESARFPRPVGIPLLILTFESNAAAPTLLHPLASALASPMAPPLRDEESTVAAFRERFRNSRQPAVKCFLNYRADPDQLLAKAFHDRLHEIGYAAWWANSDKPGYRIEPGVVWDEGLADGIFRASEAVLLLSKAGLANLGAAPTLDVLLVEFRLFAELHHRGLLHKIKPVFVGAHVFNDRTPAPEYGDMIVDRDLPACPNVPVAEVEAQVEKMLRWGGLGGPQCPPEERTVSGALGRMKSFQGHHLKGECNAALERAALWVAESSAPPASPPHATPAQPVVPPNPP